MLQVAVISMLFIASFMLSSAAQANSPRVFGLGRFECKVNGKEIQIVAEDIATVLSERPNFKVNSRMELDDGRFYLIFKSDVEREILDERKVVNYVESFTVSAYEKIQGISAELFEQKMSVGPETINDNFLDIHLKSHGMRIQCAKRVRLFDEAKYREETQPEYEKLQTQDPEDVADEKPPSTDEAAQPDATAPAEQDKPVEDAPSQ